MARSVHRRNGNVSNLERLFVLRCPGDAFAVFAADDCELVVSQIRQLLIKGQLDGSLIKRENKIRSRCMYQLLVASSMIPVAVIVYLHQISIQVHGGCRRNTYWWVLTIAVKLILPDEMASLRIGATLARSQLTSSFILGLQFIKRK